MFKTFVSLLSGHASYLQPYCAICNYQRRSSISKFTNEKITLKEVTCNFTSEPFHAFYEYIQAVS